jgi:hypothetical protein
MTPSVGKMNRRKASVVISLMLLIAPSGWLRRIRYSKNKLRLKYGGPYSLAFHTL